MNTARTVGTACVVIALAGTTAGCTSGSDEQAEDGTVTISVMGLPPETKEQERDAFLEQLDDFEEAYPDITVEASEYQFASDTFSARLAGGDVETVIRVPFTEANALIQRGQVADIQAEVDALPEGSHLNPQVMELMSNADGDAYGLPEEAYGIGLLYNCSLFEQAGLDPADPPRTWDDLQDAAIALKEVVETPYAELSQNNQGGWHIAMETYSNGGRLEEMTGDTYEVTLDDPAVMDSLETIQALRWDADAMGTQQLRNQGDAVEQFAGGQIGMWLGSPDTFRNYIANYDGNADDYCVGPMPQGGGDATLTGGWVTMVSAAATDAQREAAVKWMDFMNLRPRYDTDAAAEVAEAESAAGVPVGVPTLPLFDEETEAAVAEAIAPYVTFPTGNAQAYQQETAGFELVPEPALGAQEIYSALDTVMQAVLTDEDADLDGLLQAASDQASAAVSRLQ